MVLYMWGFLFTRYSTQYVRSPYMYGFSFCRQAHTPLHCPSCGECPRFPENLYQDIRNHGLNSIEPNQPQSFLSKPSLCYVRTCTRLHHAENMHSPKTAENVTTLYRLSSKALTRTAPRWSKTCHASWVKSLYYISLNVTVYSKRSTPLGVVL